MTLESIHVWLARTTISRSESSSLARLNIFSEWFNAMYETTQTPELVKTPSLILLFPCVCVFFFLSVTGHLSSHSPLPVRARSLGTLQTPFGSRPRVPCMS